jgi:hypothetical protein
MKRNVSQQSHNLNKNAFYIALFFGVAILILIVSIFLVACLFFMERT